MNNKVGSLSESLPAQGARIFLYLLMLCLRVLANIIDPSEALVATEALVESDSLIIDEARVLYRRILLLVSYGVVISNFTLLKIIPSSNESSHTFELTSHTLLAMWASRHYIGLNAKVSAH